LSYWPSTPTSRLGAVNTAFPETTKPNSH